MLVVHLSDLHLSRYGESGVWSQRDDGDGRWEVVHTWKRWQIEGLRDKKSRPEKLRLVDPSGVIQKARSWPKKDDKAIGALLSLAMERHLTSSESLVNNHPSHEDLASLLRVDRRNTNLLFLRLLEQVLPLSPDIILITGDITDNGFGYDLVEHYLSAWIERRRLFVVPGNHDTYDMFPRRGRRARVAAKEERYRTFAQNIGMDANDTGAWLHRVDDLALVGISSCKPPLAPLSASGEVSANQLQWVKSLRENADFTGARLRLALLHHHVLRMPFEVGKRSPIEVGLRLRNGREVMEAFRDVGFDMIFNGHRHHGYTVQLPGYPMVISSPSSTLGCKSSDLEYAWCIDLAAPRPYPVAHVLHHEPAPDAPRGSTVKLLSA